MKKEKDWMEFEEVIEDCQTALTQAGNFARKSQKIGASLPKAKLIFFGSDFPEQEIPPERAQRFLEWFLLEYEIDEGTSPLSLWLSHEGKGLAPRLRRMGEALEASLVGLFKIVEVHQERMEIEDALGRGRFLVALPPGEHNASAGDSLMGRIIPLYPRKGLFFAMGSAQVLRGSQMFMALKKKGKAKGGSQIPSFSQLELERLFEWTSQGEEVTGLEGARKALGTFLENEADLPSLAEVEEALRSVSSPGSVLDPFLEAVAFHTRKDIGEARRLGLGLWNAIQMERMGDASSPSRKAPPAKRPLGRGKGKIEDQRDAWDGPEETLGAKVLKELEAGEARGEDLESLFDRLGNMVGLKWEHEEGIPSKVTWSTSEVGDLAGLFLEFQWEAKRKEEGLSEDEEKLLGTWNHSLQAEGESFVAGVPRVKWARFLLALWTEGGSAACRVGIGLLTKFSRWLEEAQEIRLDFPTKGFLELWDKEALRCEGLEGASPLPLELQMEEGEASWSIPWFVRGREGGSWTLESGNRRMSLPGSLALMVGDRVFGIPNPVEGNFEAGYRVLPSCLALLAMETS